MAIFQANKGMKTGNIPLFLKRIEKNHGPWGQKTKIMENKDTIERTFTEKSPMEHKTVFTKPKEISKCGKVVL